VIALFALTVLATHVTAQQPAPTAQQFAPVDLTGTWVSVVTEDWAVRMITPPKGDFESLPLTPAARDTANRFDIATSEARACEAYGAPVLLRQPGRVRISWQDPQTLKLETDAGEQTRLLHFDQSAARGGASLQGFSAAEWQYANGFDPLRPNDGRGGRGGGGRGGGRGAAPGPQGAGPGATPQAAAAPAAAPGAGANAAANDQNAGARGNAGEFTPVARGPVGAGRPQGGRLKVVTDNLAAGLLRKNGVPYSAKTTVTEYFNVLSEPNGTQWFVVTAVIHDPENLLVDYILSTNFRKEPDGSKFRPSPCSLR
jgi:hypothetical protein